MNERYEQLFAQAHIEFAPGHKAVLERFAELIVRECGHCMVDIMLHGGIEPEQGYDIMLKRFGIQE